MLKDYYIVLGISRGADVKKIKKAYRTVAKKYHPDVMLPGENREKFLEVKEAYETLVDEDKRRRYDDELSRQSSPFRITDVPKIIERRSSLFDEIERFFSSTADNFFEGFLPGFFDLENGRIRGKDLYLEAVLSPREAEEGGLFPITIPVIEPCTRCSKSGMWDNFYCPVCEGYGRVKSERSFSLSIPPHVRNGTEIRLSMEDIGLRNVYLNVLITIDPYLEEYW
ncbi:MAG: DnaJ domain-containing protein [Deltaproteobacteria bacterium]|nr:DnaJ domain-containing protein [Deltaproteobacteria bacterium]